jgi:hypothetical protein
MKWKFYVALMLERESIHYNSLMHILYSSCALLVDSQMRVAKAIFSGGFTLAVF